MKCEGKHVTADIYLNEFPEKKDTDKAIKAALKLSEMTVLDDCAHIFGPDAWTAVYLLQESHFSIHTFPERNFISIDCYTCGNEGDPIRAVQSILSGLDIASANIKIMGRG
jgi:S-adenosylmethionine decarboxylase